MTMTETLDQLLLVAERIDEHLAALSRIESDATGETIHADTVALVVSRLFADHEALLKRVAK